MRLTPTETSKLYYDLLEVQSCIEEADPGADDSNLRRALDILIDCIQELREIHEDEPLDFGDEWTPPPRFEE